MILKDILAAAVAGETLDPARLAFLLELKEPGDLEALYRAAYQVKLRYIDSKVRLRGLIEVSNVCGKNCFYCGIRGGNRKVARFTMSLEEIVAAARHAAEFRYGSVVLQAGERSDPGWVDFIENAVREIKKLDGGRLGITLSLGEQSEETFRRWFDAGAHRYLLRIESSDPALYAKLHPADHSYAARVESLHLLRKTGYQVGTGVMVGLPGQTTANLVHDLEFFKSLDVDMIGMGPYIVHHDTPLGRQFPDAGSDAGRQLELGLKMIAVTRLHLRNVNIASTTARRRSRRTDANSGSLRARTSSCRISATSPTARDICFMKTNPEPTKTPARRAKSSNGRWPPSENRSPMANGGIRRISRPRAGRGAGE